MDKVLRLDDLKLNLLPLKKNQSIPYAMGLMANATIIFGSVAVLLLLLIYRKLCIN